MLAAKLFDMVVQACVREYAHHLGGNELRPPVTEMAAIQVDEGNGILIAMMGSLDRPQYSFRARAIGQRRSHQRAGTGAHIDVKVIDGTIHQ